MTKSKNKLILFVDERSQDAEETQSSLATQGYQVEWKCSGAASWEFAQVRDFGLMVLSAEIPDGPAFQWCQRIRQNGLWQPILVLSRFPDELEQVLCLEMGADDYVRRPYQLHEFSARIRALLRRAYDLVHPSRSVIYVGELAIDRQRGQVRRNQQLLNLTPTEFRLLATLADHPGQVLTRSQIIDHVWGHQADISTDEAVKVHICRLRQKVEPNPLDPSLILTVPGMGYRFAG